MGSREIFIFSVFLLNLVLAGKHDVYSGYTVHKLQLRDANDKQLLSKLTNQLDLDIWQHGMPAVRETVVMVTEDNKDAFLKVLDENEITHDLYLVNVPKALEKHDSEISTWKSTRSNRLIFQSYPRYSEIDEYMERLARQFPDLVSVESAGKSYEGRDMKYMKISTTNFTDTSKPILMMEATIHAREWVTTPVTLYSMYRLVENLRSEDSDLLNEVDWIILPLVNPDGYEYSHTDYRLWRKTRSPTINASCIGVDGNRNFDVDFGIHGVSTNPCNDAYPGTEAFSEVETRNVRSILLEYRERIQIFLDMHSYGNWILFPYGDESLPSSAFQMHFVGAAMGAAIDTKKLAKADYYVVGNAGSVLYKTSGSADDYAAYVGVPISLCVELPGYEYDFRVPPQYIDQINEETWHGIAAAARLARKYYSAKIANTQPQN